ncbi:MAG TPA: hypothetical protein VIV66_09050, partial [Pyrinomonadaceae bacterium]
MNQPQIYSRLAVADLFSRRFHSHRLIALSHQAVDAKADEPGTTGTIRDSQSERANGSQDQHVTAVR